MKKRNERKGGNDFSFSYQSEFVFLSQTFESWRLGHVRRTSDRASACTQAPRMFYRLVICFLSSCTLFMVSFKLMLFLFFFHFYYPYIPSVMDWVQFLSKFFFSVSLLYFTWYLYIHLFGPLSNIFDKIEQNHGARLMSPLTVTVKPMSLQTLERHFSFLSFLVVKECVWLDSTKGIAEKEWNNTKKFVYKAW